MDLYREKERERDIICYQSMKCSSFKNDSYNDDPFLECNYYTQNNDDYDLVL